MANKRYDEFPAGSYDPSKILLQGDPGTGALEKIEFVQIAPFLLLTIICSQAGTADPSIIAQYCNFGQSATLTRTGVGQYRCDLALAGFNDSACSVAIEPQNAQLFIYTWGNPDTNGFEFFQTDDTGTGVDDFPSIVIKVYYY